MKQEEIAVGMPATLRVGSDSYAVDIVELIQFANGKRSKRTNTTIKYAITKRRSSSHTDKWIIRYDDKYGYYGDMGYKSSLYLRIGEAVEYMDPSF